MEIVAATNNAGKLKELRRILEPMGYTLLTPADLGLNLDPEETGTTFEANALIKAEAFCKAAGKPVIADDSGLTVEALDGAPGVYSARYCGRHGDDEANNVKLLAELEDLEPDKRSALLCVGGVLLPAGWAALYLHGPLPRLGGAGAGGRERLRL